MAIERFQGIGNRLCFGFQYLATQAVTLLTGLRELPCRFISYSRLSTSARLCFNGAFMETTSPEVNTVKIIYVQRQKIAYKTV